MEKNKLDTYKRLSESMLKVLELEKLQREQDEPGETKITDRDAYERSRRYFNEGGPVMHKTVRYHITAETGNIPVTAHYPSAKERSSLIVFIHGGGFVVGSPDTHDGIMRRLAMETGAVVMGIDYSLAPESRFPVQIHECLEVIRHIRENEDLYGIDRDHITLAGDSAGAYLSLATALYLRDHEEDISYLRALLLFYGSYGLKDSMSMRLYGGAFDGLTLEALKTYGELFAEEKDRENPYRNLFNSDLTYGVPPAYIMACTLDPLADDSRLLYEILNEHGMEARYQEVDGVLHGFLHYSKVMKESLDAIKNAAEFYARYTK